MKLVPSGPQKTDGTSVTVALTSSGVAYLIPQDLARLPVGRTYQLWGQIDGRLISLGLLGSHPAVTAFSVNPNAPGSSFAIAVGRSVAADQYAGGPGRRHHLSGPRSIQTRWTWRRPAQARSANRMAKSPASSVGAEGSSGGLVVVPPAARSRAPRPAIQCRLAPSAIPTTA